MFQKTSKFNIAESLFTGLYVVVCKTEETSDKFYHGVLDFLNSNLGSFNVRNLVSTFLKKGEFEWMRERVDFSTKLRLGPTQILWNTDPESAIPLEEILNTSNSLTLLKKVNTSSHVGLYSEIRIKYISEKEFSDSYIPDLFYNKKVIATFIVHEGEESQYSTLIDLYYSKKSLYGDEINPKFQFLISKSSFSLAMKLMSEFDKYIVKENLYKYRKSGQIIGDQDLIYDCLLFLENTELVYMSLGEVVLNLLTTFLAQSLTVLNDPNNSLENVRKPISHHSSSSKSKILEFNGLHVKNLADLYFALGNDDMAIPFYLATAFYFAYEKNYLSHSKCLFSLSVSIFRRFKLSNFFNEVDGVQEIEYEPENFDEPKPDGIPALDYYNPSDSECSVYSDSSITTKPEHEKHHPKHSENIPKKIIEKPLDNLVYYLKRSFTLWLKTFDNSDDFQALFVFFTKVLLEINSPILYKVISSFIAYSKRMLTLEQQFNILKYVIDLISNRKQFRKLKFYKILHDQKLTDLIISGKYYLSKSEIDELKTDLNVSNYGINSVDWPIYELLNFLTYNFTVKEKSELHKKCKEYDYWYLIKKSIIDSEIDKMNYLSLYRESYKMVLFDLLNLLNYLGEFKDICKGDNLVDNVKGKANLVPKSDCDHFVITHLILNSKMCEDDCETENRVEKIYDNLDVKLKSFITQIKDENSEILLMGGFHNLEFKRFPIVLSISLSGHDFNYSYSKSNLKRVERFENIVKETSLSRPNAWFKFKKKYPYNTSCSCNFLKIYKRNRFLYNFTRNFDESVRSSRSGGSSLNNEAFDCASVSGSLKEHLFNNIEPKCKIISQKIKGNQVCKLRIDSTPKKVLRSKRLSMKLTKYIRNEDLEEPSSPKSPTKLTEYVYEDLTQEKVVYVGNMLNFEVIFRNPLPLNIHLKNVTLVGSGVDFDPVETDFVIPAFSKNYKQTLNLIVKEPGFIRLTSVKFLLFDTFECIQLVLDSSKPGLSDLFNEFVNFNFEGNDNELTKTKMDEMVKNLKEWVFVDLHAIEDHNKSKLELYFTDFSESTNILSLGAGEGYSYRSNPTSDRQSHRSGMISSRSSIERRTNLTSQRSSLTGTNFNSVRSTYENWNGLKIPNFGSGTVSLNLRRCRETMCNWCCIFRHFHRTFNDSLQTQKLINGERKLFYIKLMNENREHSFVNIKLTILPTTHYSGRKSESNLITSLDLIKERELQSKLQHLKREIYSRYVIILSDYCIKMKSIKLISEFVEEEMEQEELDQMMLLPNESVYVPVIYRANPILKVFNVAFDYDIVEVKKVKRYQECECIPANSHKQLNLEVDSSFSISDIQFNRSVEFNEKFLIHNLYQFKSILNDETLNILRKFRHEFDNEYLKIFLKITNNTKNSFSCTFRRKTQFLSSPETDIRWCVNFKRLSQRKIRHMDLWNFTKYIACNLELKWTCYPDKSGSIKLYDLFASKVSDSSLRNFIESECSNSNYIKFTKPDSLNNDFRLKKESYWGNLYKFQVWKMSRLKRVPNWYWSNIQSLIHQNINNLSMSKLDIQISVSIGDEEMGYTKKFYRISIGSMFKLKVLVLNKGYTTIKDYRVLVVPYNEECYTEVDGLEWTGCLDQIGERPITPVYNHRNFGSNSVKNDYKVNENSNLEDLEYEYYTCVASLEFLLTQPCTLGLNAAIIVERDNTIYWHHDPTILLDMQEGIVFPGTLLGTVRDYTPMANVYVKDSIIYSAIVGTVSYSTDQETNNTSVSVVSNHPKIPYVGSTVIAQITKIHINKAECNIVCVDGRFMKDIYKGVLTSNNVLESKNIEVFLYDWFRPGDFIKCKVIYAGEGKQFILTTAGVDLGVIKTQSDKGEDMTPISWKYFMSKSGTVEKRKVAKCEWN